LGMCESETFRDKRDFSPLHSSSCQRRPEGNKNYKIIYTNDARLCGLE
jgi:hypothetical protein